MDWKAFAKNLINIAETAAPLVGLGEEVSAGKALVEALTNTFESVKGNLASEDQAALQTSLDALITRVNAHADKTIQSLG